MASATAATGTAAAPAAAASAATAALTPADAAEREAIRGLFRSFKDFPRPGINFVDIFPLFLEPTAVKTMVASMAAALKPLGIECVVAVESRGYVFAPIVALELGVPFIPVRKPGKLPGETVKASYTLEYGTSTVEMQKDAFPARLRKADGTLPRAAIADDLLATGGTLNAGIACCKDVGIDVVAAFVMIELEELKGTGNLPVPVLTYLKF